MGAPQQPHWQGNQPPGYWPAPPGPPPRSGKRWLWLLPLLAAVVAAAVVVPIVLAGDDDATPRTASESSDRPAAGAEESQVDVPAEEELTPRPKDRDPQAVLAAVNQLDPCKLLDLEVARQRGRQDAVTISTGPYECMLAPGADYDPIHDSALEIHTGIKSDQLDRYGATPVTIGGAKAYESSEVTARTSTCRVLIPVSFTRGIQLLYQVREKSELCPTVRQYAEGTIAKLKNPDAVSKAGAQSDVAPQRPLLYGPEENDTGAVGACVDLGVLGGLPDCEPYHEVPLPTKPDDIMAATGVNRNVQCAVFKDAVEAEIGEAFVPVTWGAHCFFVDPTHVFDVRVNVDPDNRPSDYGQGDLYSGREESTVAGLAAVTFWDADRRSYEIYLSPHDDLDARGNLHIVVEVKGGRGDYLLDLEQKLPQEQADQATETMTQVVEQHFS